MLHYEGLVWFTSNFQCHNFWWLLLGSHDILALHKVILCAAMSNTYVDFASLMKHTFFRGGTYQLEIISALLKEPGASITLFESLVLFLLKYKCTIKI